MWPGNILLTLKVLLSEVVTMETREYEFNECLCGENEDDT